MTRKKNARPAGGTAEQAEEQGQASRQGHASETDCIMTPPRRQVLKVTVADFLGTGEQNGQTLKRLREILPGDGRSLRAQIERERRDTPILSGQSGYYLPATENEVRQFCASMRHRARQVWATAANVERAAGLTRAVKHQLDGQLTIDGGGDDG